MRRGMREPATAVRAAPFPREMSDDICTFHFVEHAMLDGAVGEFFGEVFDVRSFLSGKARRAHFFERYRAYHFRSRGSSLREQGEEPCMYRVCRRARNLLVDN